jgi:hypothetical protein
MHGPSAQRADAYQGATDAKARIRPRIWVSPLRLCCELVALGCLVAHGDIKAAQTKELGKAYVPADILNRLAELHPDFYPVPVTADVRAPSRNDPGEVKLGNFERDYLDKDRLIKLWNKSGNVLHKGSLRRLQKTNENHRSSLDLDQLITDLKLMINLINIHKISRKNNLFHLLTTMDIKNWNAEQASITVSIAVAISPIQSS